jgi:putative spermidine/putrescine transport system permease protein
VGLVARAAADVWRAPALVPQQIGLRGVRVALDDPAISQAVTTSTLVAALTTLLALPLAWPAARALAAAHPRGAVMALAAVIAAPLIIPGYLTATGVATWMIRLGLPSGTTGLVVAHLPVVAAYETLILLPAFARPVWRAEQAAAVLGAPAHDRVLRVTVPATRQPIIVAVGVGFAVSFAQYGSSLLAGAGTPTLPLLLVPYAQSDPQVGAVLALLALGPPLVVLLLASRSRSTPI